MDVTADKFLVLTEESFKKHFEHEKGGVIFVSQKSFETDFPLAVQSWLEKKGELFATSLPVITEPLTTFAHEAILFACAKHGYRIQKTLECVAQQGAYLGGGRYGGTCSGCGNETSTNFYERIVYGMIVVSAA